MHGERGELRKVNKSIQTRKIFGMGRDGGDARCHFEVMHCCAWDVRGNWSHCGETEARRMPDSVTLASFSLWKDDGDVSGSDLNFKDLGELLSLLSPRQPGPHAWTVGRGGKEGSWGMASLHNRH